MNTPVLELSGLRKVFPGASDPVVAVDGLDLVVRSGEIVAFLGPNGAGKTTTLDMVLGLTEPSAGSVRVLGTGARQAVLDGKVSAVLQSGGLLDDLTVEETVRLVASMYRRHLGVDEVIARAGLEPLRGRRVLKCSGGEQQRLRFALALLPSPELLVLDEPTAGMDVSARHEFWQTMHRDAQSGRTVIFATHYLEEAEAFAQRIVLVAHGKVVADGSTAELRASTSARTVSADLSPARADQARAAVRAMPGVLDTGASQAPDGGLRLTVRCHDSDAVARALFDLGGRELEVSRGSLDQTFLELTGQDLSGATR
ncbi:ABC transporter ATP-binding protein [Luteococcus peritonei]|uniref:ABC transporter ATP-binding protein n=1 Tax=Luteococcus peritonei TaxID=88874 RepID=A0ABW4RRJ2_9ACTN